MIGGIVLAAGEGSRFGGAIKQLAEIEPRMTLIERAVEVQLCVPAIGEIVVVLGAHAEAIAGAVDLRPARTVVADDWRDGRGAAVRAGLLALPGAAAWIVTLADQPLVTPPVLARFVDERGACRAAYDGAPSHPVRLTPAVAARILAGDTPRDALGRVRLVECGHLCSGLDVDTPRDLEAARDAARAVFPR